MLTKEDLQAIAGLFVPLETQMEKFEGKFDRFEGRLDKFEERLEKFEGRLDSLEVSLSSLDKHVCEPVSYTQLTLIPTAIRKNCSTSALTFLGLIPRHAI